MFWIFAGVALALALTPPSYRKLGFAVAGGIFIVFLGIVVINRRSSPDVRDVADQKAIPPPASRRFDFDQYERDKKDREDPAARTRIPLADVRFDQVGANSGAEPGSIQSIRARLYNDSHAFTLTDYSYYLLIQDCLPPPEGMKSGGQCTTVYDQRGSSSLTVPPDQARDVVISIPKNATTFAAPFKLLGTARIELSPAETRSYQSVVPNP